MRIQIVSLLLLAGSLANAQMSMSEAAGSYEVTTDKLPGVVNSITLSLDGSEIFIEKSAAGDLNCTGKFSIDPANQLTSDIVCENGLAFKEILELGSLTMANLSSGEQSVTARSTLFGLDQPFMAKVKKIN